MIKVFKNGPSKICGRQPLKKFEVKFFKGCLPQILFDTFLNKLIQIFDRVRNTILAFLYQISGIFLASDKNLSHNLDIKKRLQDLSFKINLTKYVG